MISAHQVQHAIILILQLGPSILGACFVVAILLSLFFQPIGTQDGKQTEKQLPAKQVTVGTVLVILSYVCAPFVRVTAKVNLLTSTGWTIGRDCRRDFHH